MFVRKLSSHLQFLTVLAVAFTLWTKTQWLRLTEPSRRLFTSRQRYTWLPGPRHSYVVIEAASSWSGSVLSRSVCVYILIITITAFYFRSLLRLNDVWCHWHWAIHFMNCFASPLVELSTVDGFHTTWNITIVLPLSLRSHEGWREWLVVCFYREGVEVGASFPHQPTGRSDTDANISSRTIDIVFHEISYYIKL